MDAKELANKNFKDNKHYLADALIKLFNVEKACGDELIKQARNDALEEAAKVVMRLIGQKENLLAIILILRSLIFACTQILNTTLFTGNTPAKSNHKS